MKRGNSLCRSDEALCEGKEYEDFCAKYDAISEANETFKDAARRGDEEAVTQLMNTHGVDFVERELFLEAALQGHVGIMSVMYKSKPDVLLQTNKTGETAMHLAAYHGHLAAVDQLLEWDPKLIDARGAVTKHTHVSERRGWYWYVLVA